MTNTGDFRRYSYAGDASYAVEAFNLTRSSAAPAYKPDTKRDFKVRGNSKRKSRSQLLQEQRAGLQKAVVIGVTSLLSIAMLFSVLSTNAKKNELTHEISSLETQLAVAQSENTRINSELNALVSMNMIDKYAVEELGMSKVQSNQIVYVNVSEYKQQRQIAMDKLMAETGK